MDQHYSNKQRRRWRSKTKVWQNHHFVSENLVHVSEVIIIVEDKCWILLL